MLSVHFMIIYFLSSHLKGVTLFKLSIKSKLIYIYISFFIELFKNITQLPLLYYSIYEDNLG